MRRLSLRTSRAPALQHCMPRRTRGTAAPQQTPVSSSPAGPLIIYPNAADRAAAAPISEAEFAAAMAPLRVTTGQSLAVAVSGGPDSMGLALLLNRWAKTAEVRLVGVTVDHRFREESELVNEWLTKLGMEHVSCAVEWDRNMTPGQRLNLARIERYKLLAVKAKEHKTDAICVAHHKDDQIETFLMRFSLMSGLDGLGCMAPRRLMNRVPLVRPLLGFSKLRATCAAFEQPYIEDPSNVYQYQLRARSRTFISKLEEQGFKADELLPLISHLNELRTSAAQKVDEFLATKFICDDTIGFGTTRRSFLRNLPRPVLQRVLVRVMMYYGGRVYPPSLSSIDTLCNRILSNQRDFPAYTASGCYVFQDLGHAPTLYFVGEAASRKFRSIPIASGQSVTVDNVWHVMYSSENGEPACVAYLDQRVWSQFVKRIPRLSALQRVPPRCRQVPIILSADGTQPLAVPTDNIFRAKGVSAAAEWRPPIKLREENDGQPEN